MSNTTTKINDTVYIVGKIVQRSAPLDSSRPLLTIVTSHMGLEDSFMLYEDQIALIETSEENAECVD